MGVSMEYKELFDKIQYLIKKKKTFQDICNILELDEYHVIGIITKMKENGYLVDYVNNNIIQLQKVPESDNQIKITGDKEHIRLLSLSDIHYGSKWDHPELVEYAYELAEKKECNFITNSGDIFEGDFHNKRPDHIYQVKALGMEQLDYVVEKYPKSTIPTYFITGNHDATFIKTCGADIGKMLMQQRPDLTYLGQDLADIKNDKVIIRLRHGSGSSSYSKSYKLQKYCETLPTSDMPDIILQGHFHFSGYFKNRDIYCFNDPSLQGYTPFAKSMGLPQEMGFWLIDYYIDEKGKITHIIPELYSFDEQSLKLKKKR
jgi:predicted phosphodiesterase